MARSQAIAASKLHKQPNKTGLLRPLALAIQIEAEKGFSGCLPGEQRQSLASKFFLLLLTHIDDGTLIQ